MKLSDIIKNSFKSLKTKAGKAIRTGAYATTLLAASYMPLNAATLRIAWDPNTEPDVTHYNVYIRIGDGVIGIAKRIEHSSCSDTTCSAQIDGIPTDVALEVGVTANNDITESKMSTITKKLSDESVPLGPDSVVDISDSWLASGDTTGTTFVDIDGMKYTCFKVDPTLSSEDEAIFSVSVDAPTLENYLSSANRHVLDFKMFNKGVNKTVFADVEDISGNKLTYELDLHPGFNRIVVDLKDASTPVGNFDFANIKDKLTLRIPSYYEMGKDTSEQVNLRAITFRSAGRFLSGNFDEYRVEGLTGFDFARNLNTKDIWGSSDGVLHGDAFIDFEGLHLDGDGDYVSVPNSEDLKIDGNFSIRAKVMTTENLPAQFIINKRGLSDSRSQYGLRLLGTSNLEFYVTDDSASQKSLRSTTENNLGVMREIVAIYDDNNMKLFVDGVKVSEKNEPGLSPFEVSDKELTIGQRGWASYPQFFKGIIKEIQIFDYNLSEDEVARLNDKGIYNGLVENSSSVLNDIFKNKTSFSIADVSGEFRIKGVSGYDFLRTDALKDLWGTNDGTLHGDAYVDSQGLHLDGDGDYVSIPFSENLNLSGDFTIHSKIVTDSTAGAQFILSKLASSDARCQYGVRVLSGTNAEFYITDDSATQTNLASNTKPISVGQEHDIITTYSNGVMRIMVDGNLVAEKNAQDLSPYDATDKQLFIGQRGWALYPQFFKGVIKQVEIFDKGMDLDEMVDLYQNGVYSKPVNYQVFTSIPDAKNNSLDNTIDNAVENYSTLEVSFNLNADQLNSYSNDVIDIELVLDNGESAVYKILKSDVSEGYNEFHLDLANPDSSSEGFDINGVFVETKIKLYNADNLTKTPVSKIDDLYLEIK